ncbi:MAG: hypothetical protein IPK83_06550 [Planctomycetes bacterium]|nr:hypothetical protein [Planctomycetota bacterium]
MPLAQSATLHEIGNQVEAVLWILIGMIFLVQCFMRKPAGRVNVVGLAIAFILFGISDIVETKTGKWWDPWWLLAWKGGCVLYFLIQFIRYRKDRASKSTPMSGDN